MRIQNHQSNRLIELKSIALVALLSLVMLTPVGVSASPEAIKADGLAAALTLIDARIETLDDTGHGELLDRLQLQRSNVLTAQALETLLEQPGQDPLAKAVEALRLRSGATAAPVTESASFEAALDAFHAFYGASTPEGMAKVAARYDAGPESLARAMTRFTDASLVFVTAGQATYTDDRFLALQDLAIANTNMESEPGDWLAEAGIDLTAVVNARQAVAEAAVELQAVVEDNEVALWLEENMSAPENHEISHQVNLGSTGNNVPQGKFFLSLDLGGDDWYKTNGGGATGQPTPTGPENLAYLAASNRGCYLSYYRAAVAFDASGNDQWSGNSDCGKNGGAFFGAGLLIDAGGADQYDGFNGAGGNGGGFYGGLGTLINADTGGNDQFNAGNHGTNGGASIAGVGQLIDVGAGTSSFNAGYSGTNGGANYVGVGTLIHATTGNRHMNAGDWGTNGGAATGGAGFVFDGVGGGSVQAGAIGSNGGSWRFASGFFASGIGNTQYNGGGAHGSIDRNILGIHLGVMTPDGGVNGGALIHSVGLLVDAGGNDQYSGGSGGINGGSRGFAIGMLVDAMGSDSYTAGDFGTNGGGYAMGLGHLIDLGIESDTYTAGSYGTNGGTDTIDGNCPTDLECIAGSSPAVQGLLLDAAGSGDVYSDGSCGSGRDVTVLPKGNGAQVDLGPGSGDVRVCPFENQDLLPGARDEALDLVDSLGSTLDNLIWKLGDPLARVEAILEDPNHICATLNEIRGRPVFQCAL